MIIILLILIVIILFFCSRKKNKKIDLSMEMDIYPSDDKGYINHMIHHHQVAVDMSEHLLKYTQDPRMILLCRDIIWLQKYEIWQMNNMLQSKPYVSPLLIPREKIYEEPPILQKYYPKQSSGHDIKNPILEDENIGSHNNNLNEDKKMVNQNILENKQEEMQFFSQKNVMNRSDFFPLGDNPEEQIKSFVNDGYYPNNPPLDNPARNVNLQVRSEPPNPNILPSHWNETTIQPEIFRRPLEMK